MEPSNEDLKRIFEAHAEVDLEFQKSQIKTNEDAAKSREAIHEKLEAIPGQIASAVQKSVKETVNGKIDKVNTTIGWISKIFMFAAPIALAVMGWSILWEINTSTQVAAVVQAVQDMQRK